MLQYIPFAFVGKKKMSAHTGLEPWTSSYDEAVERKYVLKADGIAARDDNTLWFDILGPIINCTETEGKWEADK